MGFFGGKKKKVLTDDAGVAEQRRATRRAVVPNTSGSGAGTKKVGDGRAPMKAGPKRVPAKPEAPTAVEDTSDDLDLPAAPLEGMILGGRAPTERTPATSTISRPPEFTGSLAAATTRNGPCRSGDAPLVEFLITKAKLLSPEQADQVKARAEADQIPLDMAAVRLGFLAEDQMVNALTQECWVPHLKVDKYEIRKKALDTISKDDAVHYGVFPVDKLGSLLTLAMINPLDTETIRVLEQKTGLDIKKVVATRAEITQGIEKYYSGQVKAKDGSISFTQDVEPKSVTQMLANVNTTTAPAPVPSTGRTPAHAIGNSDALIPEIQDIDDLLGSNESISPAIIEPISVTGDISSPTPAGVDVVEPLAAARPATSPFTIRTPAEIPVDFQLDDALPLTEPLSRKSSEPTISPGTTERHKANAGKTATKRLSASGKGGVSTPLIPAQEDEFQHAITHGKGRIFEKWVGLQTRNRIVNAAPADPAFDGLLASVYANKKAI
jgi:hypothetical protein